MAWIESHEELLNHPKSKRLKRKLSVSEHEVIGLLHFFWHWAVTFAEDGVITKFSAEDIADAIRYEGDADKLLQSLIESGFVDEVDNELIIHDWFDHAGKLILWRRKEADRLKNYRSKKKETTVVQSTEEERTPYEPSTDTVRTPENSNSNSNSNKKKKDTYPELFEQFWNMYPRRVEKSNALKKWNAQINKGEDPQQIITSAYNYMTMVAANATETQFMKHPKTFLNGDTWKEFLNPIITESKGVILKKNKTEPIPLEHPLFDF